jgi:hypothetical protein
MYAAMSSHDADPFPDLGAGWANIDNYVYNISSPSDVVVDPVLGTFNVAFESAVMVSFNGAFTHNELNAGRSVGIRLYNLTSNTVAESSIAPTGRDAGATTISMQFLVRIPPEALGDRLVFQIGGGDSYTACSWISKSMTMTNAGL